MNHDTSFAVYTIVFAVALAITLITFVGLKDVIVFRKNTNYALAAQKVQMQDVFGEPDSGAADYDSDQNISLNLNPQH